MPYEADQQGYLKHKTTQAWQDLPRKEDFLVPVDGALQAPFMGEVPTDPSFMQPSLWLSAAPVAKEVFMTVLGVNLGEFCRK